MIFILSNPHKGPNHPNRINFLTSSTTHTNNKSTMTSSSDSQLFFGLLNNDDSSVPSHQRPRKAGRRSSLDSLHELADFLPDFDDLAAFGGSDPLLDMPIITDDDTSSNTDEYFDFVSTGTTTSRRASIAAINKSKRRASTDAFVAFHRTMKVSSNDSVSSFATASETSTTTCSSATTGSIQAISSSFAASMLKSSQTREQLDNLQRQAVIQQQQGGAMGPSTLIPTPTTTPQTTKTRQLTPETVTSAAQFLSGKRPTLTAALEESRKKLKAYQDKLGCSTH